MKKIYSLFILLAFLFCCSASSWAQCDGGTCTITIAGTDGFGDGWNGASITITQGTTTVGTFTVTGTSTTTTYPVCAGPISFSWTTGSYDNEVAFTITDSIGATLYTLVEGTAPTSGVFCNDVACATCSRPLNLVASNITSDSATITWDGNLEIMGWQYQVTASNTPLDTWTPITDSTVDLSGLSANTTYYFYLRAICSVDDTSAASVLTFRTACGDNPVPFSEGFENNGTSAPFCWTIWEKGIYNSYGYVYEYPQIYNYDYYAHTGNHSLYIYDYYGANSIITPQVLLPANQVEATFWAYYSDYYGATGTLQVGYTTTNDSNTAVFHLVETVPLTSTYALYTVDFDTLTRTDSIYVCFRAAGNNGGTSTSVYIYVDDITIRQINSCPQADSLTLASTASHEVTLSWADAVGTAWEISYGPVGFDPEFSSVRVAANTNPFTVTGLSDSITYDFYVRTVCGTQHGYWSQAVTARPNLVTMPETGTDTVYVCGASIADPGGVITGPETYTTSYLVVYPNDSTMTVGLTGSITLGPNDYLYIYEGVGTSGRLLGQYSGTVPSVNVASSIGPLTLYLSTSYSVYDGFILTTNCTPLPTCTDPYNVQVSNVTGSSAMVSWDYAQFTTPDYFSIMVVDTAGDNIHYFTAPDSARSYTVTGLSEHTYYTLYVQSSCDNGDTSQYASASFFTYCLSGGEQLVGNETTTETSYYLPFYFYGYAVSQQLFDSVDLAGTDSIFGLRFYCTSNVNMVRNVQVYLDSTSRSTYTSFTDFEVQADSSLRYTGPLNVHNGWCEILFDAPFIYNGSSNITLTFDDNTGTYASSPYWKSTSTTDIKSVYGYSYSGDVDPTDATSLLAISSYSQSALNTRLNTVFLKSCGDASCVPPNASVTSVSAYSATLSWVPGLYEDSWSVEYRQSDSTDWNVHTLATSYDTAVVSGLLPATAYDFRISSLCGDTTASVVLHATTACAPNTVIPFTEGFENFTADYSEPATQQCWYRYTNYSSSYGGSYYPYVYDYYSHTGAQCLYMYSEDYGTPYTSIIILPEMAPAADTLILSFYMMGTYTSYYHYTAEVGVLTNPLDTSTFVSVDSVNFEGDDDEWQYCEVSLDSYTGTGHYPAIRTAVGSNSFYIDDITVEYFNPCRPLKNLRVFNADTASVTLSFTDTNNAGNYTIVYGTADSLSGVTDTFQATSTTVTLTGLSSATEYHAWVRANCTGCASKWVAFPTIRTLCTPLAVDALNSYEQNFEQGLDSCMTIERLVGNTDWAAATSPSNPIGAYSGGYVASLYNYSRADQAMLILPTFDFTALDNGAELTFWHAQDVDQLFVYYRTSATGDWNLLDSFTTAITSWTQHFISLPYSSNNAFYQVGFRGVAGGYGVKIDDVSVHATPTCARPTDLSVDTFANNTATLSWQGTAPSYQVRYRRVGSLSWANEYTDSTHITLTGLRGLANYECMVRGICSIVDNSNYSDPVYFSTTACASEIDYFNYDTASYASSTTYWAPGYVNYAYSYSETLVDSAELAGVTEITGFAFNSVAPGSEAFSNCNIYFGYANSSTLDSFLFDSTFVRVYHGSLNYTNPGWNKVLLDSTFIYDGHSTLVVGVFRNNCYSDYNTTYFNGVNKGSAKTIAASNYNSFSPSTANALASYNKHIDNIAPCYMFVTCAPVCNAPEITATATTENSVTLSWNSDGNYAQISYKESSSDTWSDPIDATGNFYTVTGLNHSTSYDFRLRQDCTESELGTSAWVEVTATTDYICNVPTDLQMTDADNAHATFSWTSEPGDSRWEIRVFNNSFDQTYEVSTNPATIDGLTAGKTYHAAIRTLCGPDNDIEGAYSSSIDFNTPICGSVYAVTGEAVNNYVHISWHSGNHASGYYEVQYGRQGYAENEVLGSVITPDTHVYITNLVPNFTYGFRVRSLCGLSWYSDWTADELVLTTGDPVGIEDAEAQFSCTIYPNPASGNTTISVAGAEGRVDIEVVDVNGRRVATETLECAADCTKQMDVSGLAQGTYFVRIVTTQAATVRKLIIK